MHTCLVPKIKLGFSTLEFSIPCPFRNLSLLGYRTPTALADASVEMFQVATGGQRRRKSLVSAITSRHVTASDGANNATNTLVVMVGAAANFAIKVNFQTTNAPAVPPGYLADYGAAFGDRTNGFNYGWNIDNTVNARYRNSLNSPDLRYDTFNHMQKPGGATSWEIALPNGAYQVRMISGDPDNFDDTYRVAVEGQLLLHARPTTADRFFESIRSVTVSDGRLSVGNYLGSVNNKINFIEIAALLTTAPTWLLGTAQLTNGGFHLTLLGSNDVYYVVEATTNLTTWTPVFTNSTISNRLEFVDPYATNFPLRFYRAREK